jgi:hypothetical protein
MEELIGTIALTILGAAVLVILALVFDIITMEQINHALDFLSAI